MIPFFIEKIIEFIPKVHITYINHDKPKKNSEGYIKRYQSSSDWHPFAGQLRTFESHAPSRAQCQRVCNRYYQLATLDGSEYYLCQHGHEVK